RVTPQLDSNPHAYHCDEGYTDKPRRAPSGCVVAVYDTELAVAVGHPLYESFPENEHENPCTREDDYGEPTHQRLACRVRVREITERVALTPWPRSSRRIVPKLAPCALRVWSIER